MDDEAVVPLYRAVSQKEFEDIIANDMKYRVVENLSDGKYFFPTQAHAEEFAATGFAGDTYTVTTARFPISFLRAAFELSPAGEGQALFLPQALFPFGPVTIL